MSFTLFDWCSLAFSAAAFMLFTEQARRRAKHKDVSPSFTLLTLMAVIMVPLWQLLFADGWLVQRLQHALLDVSAGMFAAVVYSIVVKVKFTRQLIGAILVGLLLIAFSLATAGVNSLLEFVDNNEPEELVEHLDQTLEGNSDQVLLELGPDDDISELQVLIDQHGAEVERAFPRFTLAQSEDLAQTYLLTFDSPVVARQFRRVALLDKENVDFAEFNTTVSLELPNIQPPTWATVDKAPVNDPEWGNQQAFASLELGSMYALLAEKSPRKRARLAIIDTGVDGEHEDLQGSFNSAGGSGDKHGHGTHCAGIAAAVTDNNIGMASFNYQGKFIEVMSFPALNTSGGGSVETVAQAILDATRAGADVVSLSLGGFHVRPPRAEVLAINYARSQNVIIVAAAGNANQSAKTQSPANIAGVISVAATDGKLNKAQFSNTNAELRWGMSAPGIDVLSLKPDGQYIRQSGTSMATPMVSGLVAVMRAYRPELTAKEAFELIEQTASPTNSAGQIGPQINPSAAIRRLLKRPM